MAKTKKDDNVVNGQTTENISTSTEESSENKKIKIELLCDVFYLDSKLKKGEVLELEKEELEKFAKSFYKKI